MCPGNQFNLASCGVEETKGGAVVVAVVVEVGVEVVVAVVDTKVRRQKVG